MDEQSGESEQEEVMGERIGKLEMGGTGTGMRLTKGVDSRDKVKHDENSNQLFLERMMFTQQ